MIQKEVGLWMRDHLPKGTEDDEQDGSGILLCRAGMGEDAARRAMRRFSRRPATKGVRYLVIDENIDKDSPDFLEKSKQGELIPLFELKKKAEG